MASFGLYTHIQSNRRRSVLLFGGLFLLVFVLVYAGALIAEAFLSRDLATLPELLQWAAADAVKAAPFAAVGTLLWILIAYRYHQKLIDAVTGAKPVTRVEQPRLWNLLENLCIARGLPMPGLRVMDAPALNAFATGLNEKQYSITVTTGLMQALDDAEMEAVLGHELTHIRNGDVRMMVIAVIIAGVVGFFAEMFFRLFFDGRSSSGSRTTSWSWSSGSSSSSSSSGSSSKKGGGAIPAVLIAIALIALAWLLSQLIRLALSRTRELLADAGSVELTKNPDAMISALRKIEGRGELARANSAIMELCVDNPRHGFADIFATHPSVDARVSALVEYSGGHDPGPLELPRPGDAPVEDPRQAVTRAGPDPYEDEPSADAPRQSETPADAPSDNSADAPEARPKTPGGLPPLPGLPPHGPWGDRR